jgi:hypothetical protein
METVATPGAFALVRDILQPRKIRCVQRSARRTSEFQRMNPVRRWTRLQVPLNAHYSQMCRSRARLDEAMGRQQTQVFARVLQLPTLQRDDSVPLRTLQDFRIRLISTQRTDNNSEWKHWKFWSPKPFAGSCGDCVDGRCSRGTAL